MQVKIVLPVYGSEYLTFCRVLLVVDLDVVEACVAQARRLNGVEQLKNVQFFDFTPMYLVDDVEFETAGWLNALDDEPSPAAMLVPEEVAVQPDEEQPAILTNLTLVVTEGSCYWEMYNEGCWGETYELSDADIQELRRLASG